MSWSGSRKERQRLGPFLRHMGEGSWAGPPPQPAGISVQRGSDPRLGPGWGTPKPKILAAVRGCTLWPTSQGCRSKGARYPLIPRLL